jgi:hypothetical protein
MRRSGSGTSVGSLKMEGREYGAIKVGQGSIEQSCGMEAVGPGLILMLINTSRHICSSTQYVRAVELLPSTSHGAGMDTNPREEAFKDRYFVTRPFSRSPTSMRSPSPHLLPPMFASRPTSPPASFRGPSPRFGAGSSLSVNTATSEATVRAVDVFFDSLTEIRPSSSLRNWNGCTPAKGSATSWSGSQPTILALVLAPEAVSATRWDGEGKRRIGGTSWVKT